MNLKEALNNLPETDYNVLSVLSGGLDSSVMTTLLVEKYGKDKVSALSYDYGQKQIIELTKATELSYKLGIKHKILDLEILGDKAKPISPNNGGTNIAMPDIKEVLGDPQPKTYVPFRNLILLSLTMAQAEANKASHVFTGLQVHDEYGYWDTSQKFVDSINTVASQNRTHKVKVVAPFSQLSKLQEINICKEINKTCGKCPSCSERIANFIKAGIKDPIPYAVDIKWENFICVQ